MLFAPDSWLSGLICSVKTHMALGQHKGLMYFSLMLHQTRLHHGMKTLDTGPAFTSTKPQQHISQDWFKDNGALQTEGCNSRKIKPFTKSHPLVGASRNSYSSGTPRTPLLLAMEELLMLWQQSYCAMLFYFFPSD